MIRVVLLASLTFWLMPDGQPITVEPVVDPEAYAVYAAIAAKQWPIRVAKARRLVVSERTDSASGCYPDRGAVETTWRSVLESYRRENSRLRRLLADRMIGVPYVLLTPRALSGFFAGSLDLDMSWRRFYEEYPDSGGITSWSAVGFDRDRRRALVFVSHQCGALCGEGHYEFLEKRRGVWLRVELPGVRNCAFIS